MNCMCVCFSCSMQKLKRNLNRNIEDLSDFKTVMQAIGEIQSTNIATELELHGIQETFAILNEHGIEVSFVVVVVVVVQQSS